MQALQKFSFVFLSLTLLLVSGCGQDAPKLAKPQIPANFAAYKSPDGWSLHYPKDWKIEVKDGATLFIAPTLKGDTLGFMNTLAVSSEAQEGEKLPLKDLGKKKADELITQGANKNSVKSEVLLLPLGEAAKVSYMMPTEEGKTYAYQFHIYQDDSLYTLRFTGSQKGHDQYMISVGKMVGSFEVQN